MTTPYHLRNNRRISRRAITSLTLGLLQFPFCLSTSRLSSHGYLPRVFITIAEGVFWALPILAVAIGIGAIVHIHRNRTTIHGIFVALVGILFGLLGIILDIEMTLETAARHGAG